MTTAQTKKVLYFVSLLFSATVAAQNRTSDSDPFINCQECAFASTSSNHPEASRGASRQDSGSSDDLSASSMAASNDNTPDPGMPPESGTIESIMRRFTGNAMLISNVDADHAGNIEVFRQLGRSSVAHWQKRGRIIWIAHTSRSRRRQELKALIHAGFDIIIEYTPRNLYLYARSRSLQTTIAEIVRQQRSTFFSTKEVALLAVLQALSLPAVPTAVYLTETHQFESDRQAFFFTCDLIAKSTLMQEESYDDEINSGYMADDEASDH